MSHSPTINAEDEEYYDEIEVEVRRGSCLKFLESTFRIMFLLLVIGFFAAEAIRDFMRTIDQIQRGDRWVDRHP